MVKKANQLKNWTTPSLTMTDGMPLMNSIISVNPEPLASSSSPAPSTSGGSSVVVNTVTKMLAKKTAAPMAKDT